MPREGRSSISLKKRGLDESYSPPSAVLRNRLVHEYDRLEHSMVLKAVKMAEDLYPIYIKEVNDYLIGRI